ncbi:hypothetical protein N665_2250s0007 [Sinapis alba]|nr:hypothetical protein N665_2250s0007 [Sinapis alba]
MNPSLFRVICILHSVIALTSGTLMMFYTEKASIFGPGSEIASKLKGSTPHDELLIQISQSFSGLLLFAIGLVLFMVSFVKDREFHSFFAGGSVILYVLMASWRVLFEWKIEDLAYEWPKQALGDIALGISWVFFLVYSWRENFLRFSTLPPLSRPKDEWFTSTRQCLFPEPAKQRCGCDRDKAKEEDMLCLPRYKEAKR